MLLYPVYTTTNAPAIEKEGTFSGIVMGTLVQVVVSIQRCLRPSPGQVNCEAIPAQDNSAERFASGQDSKSSSGLGVDPHVV